MTETGKPAAGFGVAGYRIERLLGSGGQADVFLARDPQLERPVALKLLSPPLGDDERFRERFLHESRLAASLDHPNVIPIYEAGEADGHLFIAMRYVEGTDLRRILDAQGTLTPERTIALLEPVAGALDAAHARGLVHRDVKPSNVLVAVEPSDRSEHVYLSDFGLSRTSSEPGEDIRFSGSPGYAAPELLGPGAVDGRADVYALGCVLEECLTGSPPFGGRTMEVLWAHLEQEPPAPSVRNPALPPAIDAVTGRALAKDPEDRYGTCGELCGSAREALGLGERRLSRRALLLAGGGAVVAVAAAVAVPLALPRREGDEGAGGPAVPLPLKEHSLVRVDPATGALADAAPLGVPPGPVAAEAGAIWVTSPDEAILIRVEPATGEIADRFDVAEVGHPSLIAAGEGFVWLGDPSQTFDYDANKPNDNLAPVAYRLDPETRSLTTVPTGDWGPENLAVAGGAVWSGCDQVVRILPDGRITAKVELPGAVLAVGEGAVWAAGETGALVGQGKSVLWQFDPATAAVLSETEIEPGVVDLAAGAGAVWVVRLSDDSIARVDAGTHASTEGFRVRLPDRVAADRTAVWVTSARDGTLTRYEAASADLKTIDVGGTPTGLAAGEGAVWVAVEASSG
jgi:serine/threonine-protein kinase